MLGGIERTGVEITMGEDQSIVLVFQGTVLLCAAIDKTHRLRSLWRSSYLSEPVDASA